jgi:hypothetical protein
MCYSIVTKWLHSLLVFAKEGILLEFYHVRYCKPRKCRYIFVTFWGCLNRGGGQEKKGEMAGTRPAPFSACHYLATSLSLKAIFYQFTILMTSVVPAGL